MKTRMILSILTLLFTFTSFANDHRVIYGEDNRKDIYQTTNPDWLNRARSTVALIRSDKIAPYKGLENHFKITTKHYGKLYKLCPNEPFFDQQRAASCSGSLIAEDIVIA